MNNKIIQQQILFIINKFLFPKKIKDNDKKVILINCLNSNNYIKSVEESEEPEEFEHIYQHQPLYQQNLTQEDIQTLPGFTQREHTSVNPYGFSRTFISPSDDAGTKRLMEVQKRGATPEETAFNKVAEMIDSALNRVSSDLNFEMIKNTALNIYLNITKFYIYQETVLKKDRIVNGENKGSVKKGYIVLSLYYALKNNLIDIPKDRLVTYFNDINLSDLPKADNNLKIIFKGVRGYEFMFENKLNLMVLTREQQEKVNKVMNDLTEAGLFNNLPVQIAAIINYLNLADLKLISERYGISGATIKKYEKIIENFYG